MQRGERKGTDEFPLNTAESHTHLCAVTDLLTQSTIIECLLNARHSLGARDQCEGRKTPKDMISIIRARHDDVLRTGSRNKEKYAGSVDT